MGQLVIQLPDDPSAADRVALAIIDTTPHPDPAEVETAAGRLEFAQHLLAVELAERVRAFEARAAASWARDRATAEVVLPQSTPPAPAPGVLVDSE